MCIKVVFEVASGFIALVLALYGALTISLRLSTKHIFKFLPFVCTYNKMTAGLEQLEKLDIDIASEEDRRASIIRKAGIVKKGSDGYKELLKVFNIKKWTSETPDEIIYEQSERQVDVTLQSEIVTRIDTSLKIKTGNTIKTIRENDRYDPTKILREISEEIKEWLFEKIGALTVFGSILLFLLLIAISVTGR